MILHKKNTILTSLLLALAFLFVSLASAQYNYDHVNVTTRVNVTNSMPEIINVLIDEDITLNAGGFKTVTCNATIRDWNGWQDIDFVNATFYHSSSFSGAIDNNNSHYTNASCSISQFESETYLAHATCTFEVIHYANNGAWSCNVTAQDFFGFTDSLDNSTVINELYALNVTDVIDYGDLSVLETSFDIPAIITNFGNMNINVSVLGYGATEGDGFGLICTLGTNIGVEHQRFSANPLTDWADKHPLSAVNQDMRLTIPQATDLTAPTLWETFWQLYVPPNPQGECTGTIRFTATSSI